MVALKPNEAERFAKAPRADVGLVLVYGPDTGQVSERARTIAKTVAGTDDPFSLVKLDEAEIDADPARLADEALTVPLFGGTRVVWVRGLGAKRLADAVKPLLDIEGEAGFVVIEAGDLKKVSAVRAAIEKHPRAVALPCYGDEAVDLKSLIRDEVKAAGLQIEPAAADMLEASIGADRIASRGEVRKLCLYAHDKGRITPADVVAIVGDASAFQLDDLVDAAGLGDVAAVERGVARLSQAGVTPAGALTRAIRHVQFLAELRVEVDAGRPAKAVVDGARPPIYFKRKDAIAAQLRLWTAPRLDEAMRRLDAAILASRRRAELGEAIVGDVLITLARAARGWGR